MGDGGTTAARPVAGAPVQIAGYARPEVFTFLTLPEWFIVFSADEYARFVQTESPSNFPFFDSVVQYWSYYDAMCQATRGRYEFETGYHVMLGVIGASYSIEHIIKSAYENTIGRFSAWTAGARTPEDEFAAAVARDYATFIHSVPWYRFSFSSRVARLWTEVPTNGPHLFRKWERRIALTIELSIKTAYAALIGVASGSAYDAEDLRIRARVSHVTQAALDGRDVERVTDAVQGVQVIEMPRYEAFTQSAVPMLDAGVRFLDVAGNDQILATAIGPSALDTAALRVGRTLARNPTPTDRSRTRFALLVPVVRLHEALVELRTAGATLEHLYDY